jgi:hypothetical protein
MPRLVAGARREEYGGVLLESESLGGVRLDLVADLAAGLVEPPAHLNKRHELVLRALVDVNPPLAGHAVEADLDGRVLAVQVHSLDPGSVVQMGDGEEVHDLGQRLLKSLLLKAVRLGIGAIEQPVGDHCPFLSVDVMMG